MGCKLKKIDTIASHLVSTLSFTFLHDVNQQMTVVKT